MAHFKTIGSDAIKYQEINSTPNFDDFELNWKALP